MHCSHMSKKLAGLAHSLRNTSLPAPSTLYGTPKCIPYFQRYCTLYCTQAAGFISKKHSSTCLVYIVLNTILHTLQYIFVSRWLAKLADFLRNTPLSALCTLYCTLYCKLYSVPVSVVYSVQYSLQYSV